jgi:hypothetical protein
MGTTAPRLTSGPDTDPPAPTADRLDALPGGMLEQMALPHHPTPEMGAAVCRQLAALVHAVPLDALPHCQAQLAAVQASLLHLAVRGYWYATRASLCEPPKTGEAPACFPLRVTCTAFGRCLPLWAGPHLSVVLALTARPLELALRTVVEWLDLVTLVACTHEAAVAGTVRTQLGTLSWSGSHHGPRLYVCLWMSLRGGGTEARGSNRSDYKNNNAPHAHVLGGIGRIRGVPRPRAQRTPVVKL